MLTVSEKLIVLTTSKYNVKSHHRQIGIIKYSLREDICDIYSS